MNEKRVREILREMRELERRAEELRRELRRLLGVDSVEGVSGAG